MLKLRFKNNKLNAVWLVEPKVTIGRSSGNDLVIDDPGVADQHAEIQVSYENLKLVALADDKPTLVNQKPVEGSAPLNRNDELTIGETTLVVIDPKTEQDQARQGASKQAEKTGWALKANSAALANRVFPIKPETIIGRSNECDITLAAAHLSRRHVKLTVLDGVLFVRDLGSANGTYLNGERITEARVHRGDELRFDTLSFGVMGPSQDLDQTTVRPAARPNGNGAAPEAAPKPAASQPPASTRAKPTRPARPGGAKPRPAPAASPEVEPEGKSKLGIVLSILLLLAIAAGTAFFQGYLPV